MTHLDPIYTLTDKDLAVADATTKDVPVDQRLKIIAIHQRQLAVTRERRAKLVSDLYWADRAILLREACLERLERGGDDGGL